PRSRLPDPSNMAAPGQAVLRHSTSARWAWVGLGYRHEGTAWRQTRRVVGLGEDHACVVTSQAPQRAAALANDAADQVAESLTPFPSEAAWMPNAMARQALPVGDMELVACCDDAFAVQTRSLLEAVASLKGKGLA